MSGYIKIDKILKKNNRLDILFSTSQNIDRFFIEKNFWVEYSFNIENIPNSILIVPFLSNVLPIAWITGTEIVVDELDKDFFDSVEKFKSGYIRMYPNITFYDTKIKFNNIVKNKKQLSKKKGAFFSGGVDAYATLFSHIEENPLLITVWGADIQTSNYDGWRKMKKNVDEASKQYHLEKEFIKSNFKEFLVSAELNKLIMKSNDKWWHGFQHGVGLIGLSAPVSFEYGLSQIYIASSYTKDDKVTCASYPTIDEHVKFCDTKIHHDQFELNRQEKIEKIISVANKIKKYPNLHVCWENTSGINCCKCEKCCRTMIGIMIANDSPDKYGFKKFNGDHLKKRMTWYNNIDKILYPLWEDMKKQYAKTKKDNNFKNEIDWILKFNLYKKNTFIKKIFKKLEKILNIT